MPVEVQSLIAFRNSKSEEARALIAGGLDNVRWDVLSVAAKGPTVWAALARKMGPQALRMNLNTLLRHDVFESGIGILPVEKNTSNVTQAGSLCHNMVDYLADRIADESEFRRSKQFPYQYSAAYLNADLEVPQKIRTALHKAAEIACGNVPELPGPAPKCEVRIVKCETMKVQYIRIFQTSNFLIQTSIAFLADNNQRFVAEVEAIEL